EIRGAHHEIFAFRRAVLHGNAVHRPAAFRGDNVAVPHGNLTALTQCLDAVQLRAGSGAAVGIPEGGAATLGHLTAANHKAFVMPERIAQVKEAILHLNITALLEGTFTVGRAVKCAMNHTDFFCTV